MNYSRTIMWSGDAVEAGHESLDFRHKRIYMNKSVRIW